MSLVKNGNFNNVPTFVAATTSGDAWVDGTAAGSSSNSAYGWWSSARAGSISTQFDTSLTHGDSQASMKLSTLDTLGRNRVSCAMQSVGNLIASSSNLPYIIPVKGGSVWRLEGYIQTNNAIGATIAISELNSSFVVGTTTGSTAVTGTVSTWQFVSVTATLASTAAYIAVGLANDTAGNISDAWFSSLNLVGPHEQKIFLGPGLRPHPFSPGNAR